MNIETLEVPENAVILIRDRDDEFGDDSVFEGLVEGLHERFPKSLIVLLSGQTEFETMSEEDLKLLLEGLLEHQREHGES